MMSSVGSTLFPLILHLFDRWPSTKAILNIFSATVIYQCTFKMKYFILKLKSVRQ